MNQINPIDRDVRSSNFGTCALKTLAYTVALPCSSIYMAESNAFQQLFQSLSGCRRYLIDQILLLDSFQTQDQYCGQNRREESEFTFLFLPHSADSLPNVREYWIILEFLSSSFASILKSICLQEASVQKSSCVITKSNYTG